MLWLKVRMSWIRRLSRSVRVGSASGAGMNSTSTTTGARSGAVMRMSRRRAGLSAVARVFSILAVGLGSVRWRRASRGLLAFCSAWREGVGEFRDGESLVRVGV